MIRKPVTRLLRLLLGNESRDRVLRLSVLVPWLDPRRHRLSEKSPSLNRATRAIWTKVAHRLPAGSSPTAGECTRRRPLRYGRGWVGVGGNVRSVPGRVLREPGCNTERPPNTTSGCLPPDDRARVGFRRSRVGFRRYDWFTRSDYMKLSERGQSITSVLPDIVRRT